MFRYALIGLLMVSTAAIGQVYKCKDASGKLVFSDVPCGGNAQAVNVKPSRGTTPADYQDDNLRRQMDGYEERQRERDKANARLDEIRAWNKPIDDMNRDNKNRRCSSLKADLDYHQNRVRTGPMGAAYNESRARIPALEGQISREC